MVKGNNLLTQKMHGNVNSNYCTKGNRYLKSKLGYYRGFDEQFQGGGA